MTPKKPKTELELFQSHLDQILDREIPFTSFPAKSNGEVFEHEFGALYSPGQGRPGPPIRLMVGLHYLKHAFDESDESVVERFVENPCRQYFCGFEYFQHQLPLDDTSLVKFRNRIGAKGMEKLSAETISPGLPRYAGTRPSPQIAFQCSHHKLKAGGTLTHAEFLHEGAGDPRSDFARALIESVGKKGSILIYSSFETTQLKSIALAYPALAPGLEQVMGRFVDLLPIVRKHVYHPDFHGPFSIKAVAPALSPAASYEGMAITDGSSAILLRSREKADELGKKPRARMVGQGGGVGGRADDLQQTQFAVAEIMPVMPLPLAHEQHLALAVTHDDTAGVSELEGDDLPRIALGHDNDGVGPTQTIRGRTDGVFQ